MLFYHILAVAKQPLPGGRMFSAALELTMCYNCLPSFAGSKIAYTLGQFGLRTHTNTSSRARKPKHFTFHRYSTALEHFPPVCHHSTETSMFHYERTAALDCWNSAASSELFRVNGQAAVYNDNVRQPTKEQIWNHLSRRRSLQKR